MTLLLQLLWLAVPVIVSGLVHLVVMKRDLLPGLRVLPIDGGATFRGRRAVVTIVTVAVSAWVLARLDACCLGLPMLVPFAEDHPLRWGLLLGAGYIVGELPNSFAKRQLGISPGASGSGLPGRVFWVVDQLDSLAGMLLFIWPVWHPPLRLLLPLIAIMLIVHPLAAWVMVLFGLKKRVG
jgi:CDP-archaeol synthase